MHGEEVSGFKPPHGDGCVGELGAPVSHVSVRTSGEMEAVRGESWGKVMWGEKGTVNYRHPKVLEVTKWWHQAGRDTRSIPYHQALVEGSIPSQRQARSPFSTKTHRVWGQAQPEQTQFYPHE